MNARRFRSLYRSLVSSKVLSSRAGCPSVAALRKAFDPRTGRAAKDRIVRHISSCSECAREFEFIRAVSEEEARLSKALDGLREPRPSPMPMTPRPALAGLLGAAVVGLVISSLVLIRREGPEDGWRGVPRVVPEALTPAGRTPEPRIFQWRPVPGARAYIVEVFDEALQLVWESPPVSAAALSVPRSVEQRLRQGGDFYWTITAIMPEDVVGESGLHWFVVAR